MKLRKGTLTRILALGLLGPATAGTAALAEAHRHPGYGHEGCERSLRAHHDDLRALDLSDEQRDRIFDLRHEQEPKMHEKMKELRAARRALHEAVLADRYDAAKVRGLAQKKAAVLADVFVLRAELMHQMREVLTPEQRTKLGSTGWHHGGWRANEGG